MSNASFSPSNSPWCTGYLFSPPIVKESYCAMRNCAINLMIMENCCKNATVDFYTIPLNVSNVSQVEHLNDLYNAIYCVVDHYEFSKWENCTRSQGVQAGICAMGVEKYESGAARQGAGSLMGLIGLVMAVRAMLW